MSQFLGNLSSRKLHVLAFSDNRCKISEMKETNKKFFDTEEEALTFPSAENPMFQPCGICFMKRKKSQR